MNDMKKPPSSEMLKPCIHPDVEMKLVNWIRGVAESNNELVQALSRLRVSYKVLLGGESVPDAQKF
jgi:hypothetical protein